MRVQIPTLSGGGSTALQRAFQPRPAACKYNSKSGVDFLRASRCIVRSGRSAGTLTCSAAVTSTAREQKGSMRMTPQHPEAQCADAAAPEPLFDLSDWSQRDWASAHVNHKEQEGYWIDVQGKIPADITGTYYRNGAGIYTLGNQELAHPFDGHGYIISIAIKDGKAFARARFVETPEYKSEVSQQKILFRGSFGTQRPGGAKKNAFDIFVKNAANTSIVHWGGRLLALFEAAQPVAMDPYTLETLGVDLLGGNVKAGASFNLGKAVNKLSEAFFKALGVGGKYGSESRLGGEAVTAHPRFDPDTGRLVFFKFQQVLSINPFKNGRAILTGKKLPLKSVITFFEVDEDMNLVCSLEHWTDGYTFLHDFALTPTHYVIVQNPVDLDPAPFLLGKSGAAASVKWIDGKPSEVHLLNRPVVSSTTAAQRRPQLQQTAPQLQRQQEELPQLQQAAPQLQRQSGAKQEVGSDFSINGNTIDASHAFRMYAESQKRIGIKGGSAAVSAAFPDHLVSRVPPGFVFHQGNSYYDPDTNCMVIICVRYDAFPDFESQAAAPGRSYTDVDMDAQPVAQLWRYDINMADGSCKQQCLSTRNFEFPSTHPAYAGRKARYIYGGAGLDPKRNLPIQSVAKFDLETGRMHQWSKSIRYFMGEPEFIPRGEQTDPKLHPLLQQTASNGNGATPRQDLQQSQTAKQQTPAASNGNGVSSQPNLQQSQGVKQDPEGTVLPQVKEDDGWLLAVGFDAELQRSEVVLLDAADIEAGPIAVLPLASPVGYGIHGSWVPTYYGP